MTSRAVAGALGGRSPGRLRELVDAVGSSFEQLHLASGVGLATLRRLDRGCVLSLPLGRLVAVAHALGVSPVEIVPELRAPHRGPAGLVQVRAAQLAADREAIRRLRCVDATGGNRRQRGGLAPERKPPASQREPEDGRPVSPP